MDTMNEEHAARRSLAVIRGLGAGIAAGLVLAAVCMITGPAPVRADSRFAPDRRIDIQHIKAEFTVDLVKQHVSAVVILDLHAIRPTSMIRLDAVNLLVSKVTVKRGPAPEIPVDFNNTMKHLEIALRRPPLQVDEPVQLRIEYAVANPTKGLHFFAPSEAEPDVPLEMWSQCQPNYAQYWIPCLDHPNEQQTLEVRAIVPAGNVAVSNGKLMSRREGPGDTVVFQYRQDKPLASYLIMLAVGPFEVTEESWNGVPVQYYYPPTDASRVKNAFGRTVEMIDLFSQKIGVPYPWAKYAQVCAEQFNGGMENTSATTLTTTILHDDRAHIDSDDDDLVSHELAHQWFGDLVTCRDWSHVWINEGFASLFEAVWLNHAQGQDAYDYKMVQFERIARIAGKFAPVFDRDYRSPEKMFDARVYQKAGFVLHMLRRQLGEDMFWKCVQRFVSQYRYQNVETHDLRRTFEAVSHRSLEQFFYDWLERPGNPDLQVFYKWRPEDKTAAIEVRQVQKTEPFAFPLDFAFEFAEGKPLRFTRDITEGKTTFQFVLPREPRLFVVDPDNAVLKKLTVDKPDAMWVEQVAHGPTVSARIRAARWLGADPTDEHVSALVDALGREPFWGVAADVANQLGKADTGPARAALLAGLQSKNARIRRVCASQLGKVETTPKVLSALRKVIDGGERSYRVGAAAIASYAKHQPDGAVAFLSGLLDRDSHQEVIRRAVLRGLAEQKDEAGLDILLTWSRKGKPVICRRSAISATVKLVKGADLPEARVKAVVDLLTQYLSNDAGRVLGSAISALGDLGPAAKSAVEPLQKIAADHSEERVRKSARKAIEKIEQTGKRKKGRKGKNNADEDDAESEAFKKGAA